MNRTICLAFSIFTFSELYADVFGGIEFPQGASSFADSVIRYDPLYNGGPAPTEPLFLDPNDSLGIPDFPPRGSGGDPGAVALGRGGLIEIQFIDNNLSNSGNDDAFDLHIFEVGPNVEDTFVAIHPTNATLPLLDSSGDTNGDGFYEIGKVYGSTSSIDIDVIFPGFAPGVLRFDAVQLIDDPNEGLSSGTTVGADIDAVGAISSENVSSKPQIYVEDGFIRLHPTSGNTPADEDCNRFDHRGRMVLDEINNLLYICTQSGWISK